MSIHARLSLSHSNTWMVCAAWPRITEGMPDDESPEIAFGNNSHAALESMLLAGDATSSPHSAEENECAQVAFDYVSEVWACDTSMAVVAESELRITSLGRDDLYGTADVVMCTPDYLEIVDLKTGAGTYVCEKSSSQLKLYALAAMDTMNLHPKVISLTIVQPRHWSNEPKVRTLHTTEQELRDWAENTVLPAAIRTDDPEARGTAGEHCKTCSGRHVCEYRDTAVAEALTGTVLHEEPMKTTMNVTEQRVRAHQDKVVYDNDRLGEVLMMIPVIRDYCDALEEHAKEVITKGEIVPGYKVVETKGKPTWVGDMYELLEKLNKSRLRSEDYMTSKLRTPKQVAALKTGPKHDKPLSKALQRVIADHTGRTPGGLVLVLESDPRKSIAPAFAAIEETPEILQETTNQDAAQELPAFLQ